MMTHKEAIETLRANYPDRCFSMLREAVDVAMQALVAQEPRLMLQGEVFMEFNARYAGCVWLETKHGGLAPVFPDIMLNGELRVFSPYYVPSNDEDTYFTWWNIAYYGITWRCWTQRPTDEQRETEAWPEQ
ncbi:MAG: hypothetical protein IJ523_10425 [Succinivibrionaceae bacterium]|nr:hypothetical protein [Succinivibrionaceae bacterium]